MTTAANAIAIEMDLSLPGKRVARVLDRAADQHGWPKTIVEDNGPEFTGKVLDQWAFERGVRLHFIDPGKPVQNAFVGSFNGKLREECLSGSWFVSLDEAGKASEDWRHDYNHVRPHKSLGWKTLAEVEQAAIFPPGRLLQDRISSLEEGLFQKSLTHHEALLPNS